MTDELSIIKKVKPNSHTRYEDAFGKRVPGVTTVIDTLSKPQLISWANRMGLDGIDTTKYVDSLAEVGTIAHHMVMCHHQRLEPDFKDFAPSQVEVARNSLRSYIAWEKQHTIEPVLCETPMVHPDGWGGTPDLLCELDGVPTLLDFKTGKALYFEVLIQLGAYTQLLETHHWYVEEAVALRIGREAGEGFEVFQVKREALDLGYRLFESLFDVYTVSKMLKKKYWKQ
jgi:hypothetical protein